MGGNSIKAVVGHPLLIVGGNPTALYGKIQVICDIERKDIIEHTERGVGKVCCCHRQKSGNCYYSSNATYFADEIVVKNMLTTNINHSHPQWRQIEHAYDEYGRKNAVEQFCGLGDVGSYHIQ